MFQIGDKIVYPMHGAGIIEAIEEKEILGEKQFYFVMNLKNMKIMFPMAKSTELGIRQVVNADTVRNLLEVFNDGETDPNLNQNQRYRVNMNKMKSGDIYEGAEVIRDLMRVSRKKSLGTGDKVLLDKAKDMLAGELALVEGINEEQAYELLNDLAVN